LPFKGPKAPAIKAEYLKPDANSANADAICARVTNGFGTDFIIISNKPGTALSFNNSTIRTDAAAVVIRTDRKGKILYSFVSGGSATYKGKPVSTLTTNHESRTTGS